MKILFPSPKKLEPVQEELPLVPLSPIAKANLDIVVDVSYLTYRSAYAYFDLKDKNGHHTGHVYGTVMALLTLFKDFSPNHNIRFVYALDGVPVWRKQQHPGYKEGRVKTLGYDPRVGIEDVLRHMTGTMILNPKEEADDVIAAYIKKYSGDGRKFVLLSSDKDMWVLKDSYNIKILGNRFTQVKSDDIEDKFFTKKSAFVSLAKAIIGDEGDNLPKVLRFPRKDLATIFSVMEKPEVDLMLSCAETLSSEEKITKRSYQLLVDNEEQIRKTFSLATLRDFVSFKEEPCTPNYDALVKFLMLFECMSLVPRLNSLYGSN